MLRRLFWVALGFGLGFGLSLWARKELQQLASRFTPERLGAAVSAVVRDAAADLRAAMEQRGGPAWRGSVQQVRRLEARQRAPRTEPAGRVAG